MASSLLQVPTYIFVGIAVSIFGLVSCTSPAEVELPVNSRLTEVFRATLSERTSDLGVYELNLECSGAKGSVRARVTGPGEGEETFAGELPCSESGQLIFVKYGLRDGYVVRSRYDYDKDLVLTALGQALDKRFGSLALELAVSEQVSREHKIALSASHVSSVDFTCESRTQRFRYTWFHAGTTQSGRTSVACKETALEHGHAAVRLVNLRLPVSRKLNYDTSYNAFLARAGQPQRVSVEYADTYRVLTTKGVSPEEAASMVDDFVQALGPRKTF